MLRIHFTDFVSDEILHKMAGIEQELLARIKLRKLKYFGHMTRKTEECWKLDNTEPHRRNQKARQTTWIISSFLAVLQTYCAYFWCWSRRLSSACHLFKEFGNRLCFLYTEWISFMLFCANMFSPPSCIACHTINLVQWFPTFFKNVPPSKQVNFVHIPLHLTYNT